MSKLPYRKDVPEEMTWDLSLIYKSTDDFEADVEKLKALSQSMVDKFKGKITDAATINACLDDYQEIQRLLALTVNYTDLAASVDYYDQEIQQRNDRMMGLSAEIGSRISFVESEISEMPEAILKEAMEQTRTNQGIISKIIRNQPHRLTPETEKVLSALSQQLFMGPYAVYNMSKLADMKFDSFTADGKEYPLGYSLYEDDYEYEENTEIRRAACEKFYEKLRQYENTTAATYNNHVRTDKIMAKLRGFDSVFDSLLFDQQVTREMYDRQIDLIMTELAPHMRKYARLLQKIHHLDKMTYGDLKITVDPSYSPRVTIAETKDMIKEGLSVMGPEYQELIERAFDERWIDFAKNQGKTTGGFCATPYGTPSFILMSFNGVMSDVFTLAHELGHAGHFDSCNSTQSICDTEVSCYFVEAPSTMNELLMAHYMLKKQEDPRFRRWVLSNMISNTYYHNFVTHLLEAAYQREVYQIIDEGGSVQAETLNGIYRKVLEEFWGDAVELNDGAELTWMRQPHYYMGLYSYTYSAGLTVATQNCLRIEREGAPAVDDWKKVLAAGSTKTPVELAQMAGVDITTDQPLRDTISYIGSMIEEICALTEELGF